MEYVQIPVIWHDGVLRRRVSSLKRDENEIQVALTEKMGGWGLKARFMDMSGINF